jgi:hypothetical protein
MFTRCTLPVQRLRFWALAIPLLVALGSGSIAARADGGPLRPYYYFLHWVAMGQPDDALAQFADDAVVIAGPLCTAQRPCVGRAEIRARYIVPLLTRPRGLPIIDAHVDGGVLRVYGELPGASRVHAQGRRRAGEHRFEFRDGLISAVRVGADKSNITAAALIESSAPCAAAFRNTIAAPFAAAAAAAATR